jgi:Zc3h12a-like Ribonuclease NYN domain
MPPTNVVVDGSNIATEGRSTPSLEQLDQAVMQYLEEHPGVNVTVIVDATFGHRIDRSERRAFEEAVAHGELISPPAGAIGRGDAFVLRIAERTGAQVLSNDSFREFLEEHPWLFDEDRLMGATPVPGIGWIFSPRRPVRGPSAADPPNGRKRRVTRPVGSTRSAEKDAVEKSPATKTPRRSRKAQGADAPAGFDRSSDQGVRAAIAQATEEALGPGRTPQKRGSAKNKNEPIPEAVNDPLPFITFASEHPVGSELEGKVVSFTSHGAMAQVDDMLCYVPLAGLADPPPRRARDLLRIGEVRTFQLVALDPSRRGAQLALPEVVASHGLVAEGAEEAASEVRNKRTRRGSSASSVAPADGETSQTRAPRRARSQKKAASPGIEGSESEKVSATRRSGRSRQTEAVSATPAPVKAAPTKKAATKRAAANAVVPSPPTKVASGSEPQKRVSRAAKPAKATKKATKGAGATKATKATKSTKAAKATDLVRLVNAVKASKAAKAVKPATPKKRAAVTVQGAAKSEKAAKSTKTAKTTKAAQSTKAAEPQKAVKIQKAAKSQKSAKAQKAAGTKKVTAAAKGSAQRTPAKGRGRTV